MPEPRTCPQCGSPLPADAPDGMCPKCLLQMGFESGSGRAPDDSAHSPTVYQPGSLPPSIEDLAARFPQLELLERIGQGGMGVVYKARQKDLDRIVALKILRPEMESDPAFAGRFVREARALAKLSHPAIVTVHDFGRIDGFYYFIMEFIEGANLRELERSGKLQPRQALAIVPPICEALQYAHDQGVVHRDIKPENILIDTQGRVKIADFGLAKMVGAVPDATALTGAWQVMGTPHYMAPEQMKSSHSVDHRADIYSLGVVIYEMLTGELPVGRFPLPSRKVEIDVRLDEVVLKALEQEPAKRYQRAHELQTDVETIGSGAGARRAVSEVNSRIVDWTYVRSSPLGNPAVREQPAPENRQKPLGLVSRHVRGLAITLLALACLLIGLWSLFLAALTFALPVGAEDELDVLMRERPGLRTWHAVHQTAESWLEFPLAYALLAAGVGLLLRRPWGRWLASVWAVVNLILGLALLPVMFAGIALMFLQSPVLAPEGEMEPSVLLAAFLGTLVVVTLDIVFPIIVLLVLSRPWVKEAFVRRGIAGLGEPDASSPDSRGAFGQARFALLGCWAYCAERHPGPTRLVLLATYLLAFVLFFGMQGEGGPSFSRIEYQIGMPYAWYEYWGQHQVGAETRIHLWTPAWLFAALAFAALHLALGVRPRNIPVSVWERPGTHAMVWFLIALAGVLAGSVHGALTAEPEPHYGLALMILATWLAVFAASIVCVARNARPPREAAVPQSGSSSAR